MMDPFGIDRSLVNLEGLVVKVTKGAVLLFHDDTGQEVFIPKSQVHDWFFTRGGSKQRLSLNDLELNDEITLVVPRWLAKRENLVDD
jgi:hypothetical protein